MTRMDRLEARQLLAAQPTVTLSSKGTLTITGTDTGDAISVSLAGKSYVVETTHIADDIFQASAKYTAKSVRRIVINALGGNDTVIINKGVNDATTIDAGNGKDRVDVLGNSKTKIDGGTGNDRINHRIPEPTYSVFNTIRGGDSREFVYRGADTNGRLAPASSIAFRDVVSSGGGDALVISGGNSAFFVVGAGGSIVGGSGDDVITTNVAGDTIDGGAGNNDRLITNTGLLVRTTLPEVIEPQADGSIRISGEFASVYSIGNEFFTNQ